MYITSMEIAAYKYIANFHSPEAADQFETYIKSLIGVNDQIIGIKARYRNSIIFVCHDRDTGHQLGKAFEDDYINKIAQQEAPQQPTQPEEIHVVEETTPEAPVEEPTEEPAPVEESIIEALEAPNTEVVEQTEETAPEEPQTPEIAQPTNPLNKIFNVFKGNNN
jgi:hypothetical protein